MSLIQLQRAFLALVFLSSSIGMSQAASLPGSGIPDSGFPNFTNKATLLIEKNAITASGSLGTGSLTLREGAQPIDVSGFTFSLNAFFDSLGILDTANSSVTINGSVSDPALGGTLTGLLFQAKLSLFGSGQDLFGFKTIEAVGPLADLYFEKGGAESVYFSLIGASTKILGAGNVLFDNVTAVTTVPIPATVWLLGSALVGFFSLHRRRMAA